MGAVLYLVAKLRGDVAESIAAERVLRAIVTEEANYPFGLLKGLDGRVEPHSVKATIVKTDVILMVFVKGVHGFLPRSEIPRRIHRGRLD